MSARKQLEQLGVPTEALDAYRREIRAEAAAELYDAADNGDCGCGCWCAEIIDPDRPCPRCKGAGGSRLGHACYLCGLERTTPPEPRSHAKSFLVPLSLYEEMLADSMRLSLPLLSAPAPRFTGVLAYLEDSEQ